MTGLLLNGATAKSILTTQMITTSNQTQNLFPVLYFRITPTGMLDQVWKSKAQIPISLET